MRGHNICFYAELTKIMPYYHQILLLTYSSVKRNKVFLRANSSPYALTLTGKGGKNENGTVAELTKIMPYYHQILPLTYSSVKRNKVFLRANSSPYGLTLTGKGGKNENGTVASPDSVLIHLKGKNLLPEGSTFFSCKTSLPL